MKNKLLERGLAFIVFISLLLGLLPLEEVRAAEISNDDEGDSDGQVYEIIEIYTVEDLVELAGNCYIDSWSRNKSVTLMADIDLSDEEKFTAIPMFGGIFDGNGHTISGYNYTGDGYATGFFRYIESTGLVKRLTIKGNIGSSDESECVGGICGINFGEIKSCTFRGTVSGYDTVGGIAGINENGGVIASCIANGSVTGSYSSGGIAGINHGTISTSTNRAGVNDSTEWVEEDDELGTGIFLSITVNDDEMQMYSGVDAGGIAGYSDGVISRCTNVGTIGYAHTGYNIGGIAGRQAGLVYSCTNRGEVYGRKDVGGVVGQMEPYIEVDESESLRNAIEKLHDLIDKLLDDMQETKDVLKSDTDALSVYADGAVDAGDDMAAQLTDFTDENIAQINALVDRVEYVMDSLPAVMDRVDVAIDNARNFGSIIDDIGDDIDAAVDSAQDAYSDVKSGIGDAADDAKSLAAALDEIDTLEISGIIDSISGKLEKGEDLDDDDIEELSEALSELSESISSALSDSSSAVSSIASLSDAVADINVSDGLDGLSDDVSAAGDSLQMVASCLKDAADLTRGILDYLNTQEDIEFKELGDDFDAARESMYDNLTGISDSLSLLSDNASMYSDVVNEDLRAVNDQLDVVFRIFADAVTDVGNLDLEEYYEDDIDDETLYELTTGRVDACTNAGVVNGDINVGGIAGSMSVDSEDLEDNAAGDIDYEVGSRFIVRCAITQGVNEGYVTAKKDGAGGIVGYMNHGIVADSEGYGSVESTEGSFVGGIAGESHTIIRRCYALCAVSGLENVGGIAGYAENIQACYAMADVSADTGKAGAVAGQVADDELFESGDEGEPAVSENYYVADSDWEDGIYGIDGISYAGIAEPISYDELLKVEGLPKEFWHLQVIYKVDDIYLGSEEVEYGKKLDSLNYPEIPEKEGYYAVWEDVKDCVMLGTTVVKAEYRENVAVVQSGSDGVLFDEGERVKPYALVSESFTEDTVLNADIIIPDIYPDRASERESITYEVVLENSGVADGESFALRLLNPYDDASVWVYRDGVWSELECKVRGEYIQVDMTGESGVFCIVDEGVEWFRIILIAVAVVAAVAIVAALAMAVRRRLVKRQVRREKDEKQHGREKQD